MKIKHIFKVLALAAVFVVAATTAQAQTDTSATPEVFVRNLSVTQSSYNSGDTVKGTFTLVNDKNTPVSNVSYSASLVGNYNEVGLAGSVHDTVRLNSVNLAASESRTISFSYKLPAAIAGEDLGIQIQASLAAGIPLGWADFPITIKGENKYLTLSRASLSIDEAEYDPNAGPVLPKTSKAALNFRLTNSTDEGAATQVQAVVKVYNRSVEGTPIKTIESAPVTIAGGEQERITVDLPNFEGKPGVYVGTVSFVNGEKTKIANEITFRYIVEGQIATINTLTTDKQNVQAGENIQVAMSYGGTPYNIDSREMPNYPDSTVIIMLYSEKDKLVGSYTGQYNFDKDDSATFPIVATGSAKALRADATITSSDGRELAHYTGNISSDYDLQKQAAYKLNKKSGPILMLVLLGVIAGVFLVRYLAGRKPSKRAWMIALVVGIGALGFFPNTAHMFTIEDSRFWGTGNVRTFSFSGVSIAVKINNVLTSVNNVAPGQQYYLIGNVYAPACANSLQQLNFMTVNPTNAVTNTALSCPNSTSANPNFCAAPQPPATKGYVATGNVMNWGTSTPSVYTPNLSEVYTSSRGQFSLGPMTAPNTAGSYKVWLRVNDYWANNANYKTKDPVLNPLGREAGSGDYAGWVIGYQDLIVAQPGSARIEVIGSDNTTNTAPAGSQVQFSRSGNWNPNPGSYSNVTTNASYDFWAKDPGSNYTKTVGVCNYAGSGTCTPASYAAAYCDGTACQLNGVKVNAGANNGTKVVFKYILNASPVTGSCSASPNPIELNSSTTWSVSGVSGGNGSYTYAWSGTNGLSGTGSSVTKTYSTTDGAGTKNAAVKITSAGNETTIICTNLSVNPLAAPNVSLNANPKTVAYNAASSLTWTSTDASSCYGTNFSTGGATSNSAGLSTGPLQETTTYTITCTGPGGNATDSETVTVNTSTGGLSCQPENPANPGVRIVQAPVGEPVKWVATGPGSGSGYVWTGTVSASNVKSVTRVYTTVGYKEVKVSYNGITVQCDAGTFSVSNQPGYKEF
jgi:hypothetical protein